MVAIIISHSHSVWIRHLNTQLQGLLPLLSPLFASPMMSQESIEARLVQNRVYISNYYFITPELNSFQHLCVEGAWLLYSIDEATLSCFRVGGLMNYTAKERAAYEERKK